MDCKFGNSRGRGRRLAPWKLAFMVIAVVLSSMCSADPSAVVTPSPSASSARKFDSDAQSKSQDFLALSDVANATRDFKVRKSDYFCASGECHDALKAYALLAKRLLSDPRMLGLRRRRAPPATESTSTDSHPTESSRRYHSSDFYPQMSDKRGRNDRHYDNYINHRQSDSYGYDTPSSSGYRDHYNDGYTAGYGNMYDDAQSSYQDRHQGPPYKSQGYPDDRDGGYGGGGGGSYGGGGGYDSCGGYGQSKFLPVLVVASLGILAFYLYLRTTTTTAGRGFGHEDDEDPSDVLLDGPTWLSLIHELWEQDGALEEPSCAQHTLCRMNRMAMAAPGQAGWAVSMSSLPLSYLLHHRHGRGFVSYMDASLMGRTGVNCTEVFSQCSRLQ